MIISSQYHIESIKSCKFSKNVGSANEFLNESLSQDTNKRDPNVNSGNPANIRNANYVFNEQICDEITKVRLDRKNVSSNNILNDLKLSQNFDRLQTNFDKNMQNSKSNYKKLRKKLHDPTINNVITSSTIKYALLAVVTLIFICIFLFFVVIGSLGLDYCGNYKKIPIYLLVMGAAGFVHIFIYYSCPYDFSKSTISKMYEHLIWRLLINRYRASYYSSIFYSSSIYENSGKDFSDLSFCSKFSVKLSCCSNFFLKFFCCDCCCLSCCKQVLKDINKNRDLFIPDLTVNVYDVSENEKKPKQRNSTDYSSLGSNTKFCASSNSVSNNNIGTKNIFINKLNTKTSQDREKTPLNISNNSSFTDNLNKFDKIRKSKTTSSLSFSKRIDLKRSRSANELGSHQSKMGIRKVKRATSMTDHSIGNRYFNGRYGHKYATHKHLYRHHKKTHQPIKIVDFHSIRYCIFYLIKRALGLFLLIWFFCGNYWIFNPEFKESIVRMSSKVNSSEGFTNNTNRIIGIENILKIIPLRTFNEINLNNSISPSLINLICYDIAFFHIIFFYLIFGAIAFVIILYKFYLIVFPKNRYK